MKILLATDGSDHAKEAAAQCGEFVSGLDDATVKLISVADYTAEIASEPFMSSKAFFDRVEEQMREKADEMLVEAEEIIRYKNDSVKIEKEVLFGSAKKLIVSEAEKWDADLIIVGSHGYGFIRRAFLGSVSDAVVHHAPCSVLVARKSE